MEPTTKIPFLLSLADTALIAAQRNSEWTGHGPALEQDIALSNIALDQIGQARLWYQYCAELMNESGATNTTEDTLAYFRDAREYRNCLLVELPNGHWGQTILKQFFLSTAQYILCQQLKNNEDERIAAIAEKSLKEITYHLRWSSEWVIRLGDGTEESRTRMEEALENVWPYTGEFFQWVDFEEEHLGKEACFSQMESSFRRKVDDVLETAGLMVPSEKPFQQGGKSGIHTEHLGYLLAEMQFMQRAYPGNEW